MVRKKSRVWRWSTNPPSQNPHPQPWSTNPCPGPLSQTLGLQPHPHPCDSHPQLRIPSPEPWDPQSTPPKSCSQPFPRSLPHCAVGFCTPRPQRCCCSPLGAVARHIPNLPYSRCCFPGFTPHTPNPRLGLISWERLLWNTPNPVPVECVTILNDSSFSLGCHGPKIKPCFLSPINHCLYSELE